MSSARRRRGAARRGAFADAASMEEMGQMIMVRAAVAGGARFWASA
ncbi:MAG: hypothetical protein ACLUW6_07275 [Coriobacteriaceae bacterium]